MNRTNAGPMTGRTVVVTGGSRGIGRATARALARLGADVAVTGRDPARTRDAADQIRSATGARVHAFTADLSAQVQVRRLAAELLDTLPRIDVLVNNAGGYWNTRHVTADGLERTFAVNHLAPFLLTALLRERLQDSDDGRVVTVSSNAEAMGRDRLRGPQRRTHLLRSPRLQPVQARQHPVHPRARREAARDRGDRERGAPRSRAHLVRRRGPRAHPTAPGPPGPSVHEEPRPRGRDVGPPRVQRRRSRAPPVSSSAAAGRSAPRRGATTRPSRDGSGSPVRRSSASRDGGGMNPGP